MKSINLFLTVALTFIVIVCSAQPGDAPNREPGKCYAKSIIPDEYKTTTETVIVKPATTKTEVIPTEYQDKIEEILVKEAASRIEKKPALYVVEKVRYRVGCPEGYTDGMTDNESGTDECFRMIPVPATFKTITENYVVKEASTKIVTKPAVYKNETQTVIVKEATTRLEVVPAVYETRRVDQLVMEEASSRIEIKPAPYTTVQEPIVISPVSSKWVKKKDDENCLYADPEDCFVWNLVEVPEEVRVINKQVLGTCEEGWTQAGESCMREILIPAKYSSRSEEVVASPASVREITVPAEIITITKKVLEKPATQEVVIIPEEVKSFTKQVVDQPASTRKEVADPIYKEYIKKIRTGCPDGYTWADPENPADDCIKRIEIPAQYGRQTVKIVSKPASTRQITIPEESRTITKKELVKKGRFTDWKEVVCSKDITPDFISRLQRALIAKGYDVGSAGADGLMGEATKAALVDFQKANGIPFGNIDIDTLNALEIYN